VVIFPSGFPTNILYALLFPLRRAICPPHLIAPGQIHTPAAIPRKRVPGNHWIWDWVDTRTGLDDVENKSSWPYRNSNSDPLVVQPVASIYTDYATPAPGNRIQSHKSHNCLLVFLLYNRGFFFTHSVGPLLKWAFAGETDTLEDLLLVAQVMLLTREIIMFVKTVFCFYFQLFLH
jgi:hypothetical protein